MGLRQKLLKRIEKELNEGGVTTKAVSSEDGSQLTMRSADEIKKLLDLAGEADAAASGRNKLRRIPTVPPGVYD